MLRTPGSRLSYLLPGFAAAFFGSTTIVPGRFNPVGSLIAVYFLAFGISGVTIQDIETYVQNLFLRRSASRRRNALPARKAAQGLMRGVLEKFRRPSES